MLAPDGQIIIDLRSGQDQRQLMEKFKIQHVILDCPDRRRVVLARKDPS
jgi:hypothetical protein